MYSCASQAESTERTLSAIQQVPDGHASILVAHSGPAGLGEQPQDICGVDFRLDELTMQPTGGDWGDKDLREALDSASASGRYAAALTPVHRHAYAATCLRHCATLLHLCST